MLMIAYDQSPKKSFFLALVIKLGEKWKDQRWQELPHAEIVMMMEMAKPVFFNFHSRIY